MPTELEHPGIRVGLLTLHILPCTSLFGSIYLAMSKLLPMDPEGSERGDGDFVKHHLKLLGTKAPYYKTGTFTTLV